MRDGITVKPFCKLCNVRVIHAKGCCRICYKKAVRNGLITVQKQIKNFICKCGSTNHCAKGYCSKCYEKTPERQRPERKEKLEKYCKTNERKEYKKYYNVDYRASHTQEHKDEGVRFYQRHKERLNQKNMKWGKNNPAKWRKIQLRSQTKYLKSLEPFLNKEYNHIPYLYKVWGDEVKQNGHGICAITDCFETDVQAHHIFQKKFLPKSYH